MNGFDAMVLHLLGQCPPPLPTLPGRRYTLPDVERDTDIAPRVLIDAEVETEGGDVD